jgi:hypothetical protein
MPEKSFPSFKNVLVVYMSLVIGKLFKILENTNGNMHGVTTWKKRQKTSEAESFKLINIKYSTHMKMAM